MEHPKTAKTYKRNIQLSFFSVEVEDLSWYLLMSQFVCYGVCNGYSIIFIDITTSFLFAHSSDVSNTQRATGSVATSTNVLPKIK